MRKLYTLEELKSKYEPDKIISAIEENFQMVEDQGNGTWLSKEEGHRPIDWINTMKFLCE